MRFYKIEISDPASGTVKQAYTSANADGSTNPAALDIELNVPVFPFATPGGGAYARVWGIPLQQISQASDLNGQSIKITVGMAKGLPLANPKQQGLIVNGTIFPAFGNWIDTDQTLDLIIAPPFGTPDQPTPIVHSWKKGAPLADVISQTLKTAFPTFKANVQVSSNLQLPADDLSIYPSVAPYATYLRTMSQRVNAAQKGYQGINLTVVGDTINVYDGSAPLGTTVTIAFQDLIGQPTWIGLNTLQANTVMRGDLTVGQMITMPPTITTNTSQSASQFRQNSGFQGTFMITSLRHIGRFRQETAKDWLTVIEAVSGAASS